MVIGFWLLVIGDWLLVIGDWWLKKQGWKTRLGLQWTVGASISAAKLSVARCYSFSETADRRRGKGYRTATGKFVQHRGPKDLYGKCRNSVGSFSLKQLLVKCVHVH